MANLNQIRLPDELSMVLAAIPLAAELLFSGESTDTEMIESASKKNYDDDVDEIIAFALNFSFRNQQREKVVDFVRKVVPNYSNEDFRRHFRLRRETVEILVQMFGPDLIKKTQRGRLACDVMTWILLSLWTLANQESFRCIADRFGVCEGHVYVMYIQFCETVADRANEFVIWPSGNGMKANLKGFENLRVEAFPGVVGCVDGTYIPIKGRKCENPSYHTRKGFGVIILQGICNSKLMFIDIFVGWPGSSHDGRLWRNSPIAK